MDFQFVVVWDNGMYIDAKTKLCRLSSVKEERAFIFIT